MNNWLLIIDWCNSLPTWQIITQLEAIEGGITEINQWLDDGEALLASFTQHSTNENMQEQLSSHKVSMEEMRLCLPLMAYHTFWKCPLAVTVWSWSSGKTKVAESEVSVADLKGHPGTLQLYCNSMFSFTSSWVFFCSVWHAWFCVGENLGFIIRLEPLYREGKCENLWYFCMWLKYSVKVFLQTVLQNRFPICMLRMAVSLA